MAVLSQMWRTVSSQPVYFPRARHGARPRDRAGRLPSSWRAGNLTLLGSVANLIVVEVARGERVRVGFVEYCRVGVPLTVLTLLAGWLILTLIPV
jgi:hypothetical protein